MTEELLKQADSLAKAMKALADHAEDWADEPAQVSMQWEFFSGLIHEFKGYRDSCRANSHHLEQKCSAMDQQIEANRVQAQKLINELTERRQAIQEQSDHLLEGLQKAESLQRSAVAVSAAANGMNVSGVVGAIERVESRLTDASAARSKVLDEIKDEAASAAMQARTHIERQGKEMKASFGKLAETIQKLTDENAKMRSEIDQHKAETSDLKARLASSETNRDQALGALTELKAAHTQMQADYTKCNGQLGAALREAAGHTKRADTLSQSLQSANKAIDEAERARDALQIELQSERKRPRVGNPEPNEPETAWSALVLRLCNGLRAFELREHTDSAIPDGWDRIEVPLHLLAQAYSHQAWTSKFDRFIREGPRDQWLCVEAIFKVGHGHETALPDPDNCLWHDRGQCCQVRVVEEEGVSLIEARTVDYRP